MNLQHVNIKIYVEGEPGIDAGRFIGVFHDWVREQEFDELLIDVADYRHVPDGPGVVLVGLEADYGMDNAGGRWGLLYNRKAELGGDNAARLGQAFGSAARACRMLEARFEGDGGGAGGDDGLRFSRTEFELFINDRALAPNTAETLAACGPELESFIRDALGQTDFALKHHDDPRERFSVTVTTAGPIDLDALPVG